jgi:hypothetical protein
MTREEIGDERCENLASFRKSGRLGLSSPREPD